MTYAQPVTGTRWVRFLCFLIGRPSPLPTWDPIVELVDEKFWDDDDLICGMPRLPNGGTFEFHRPGEFL